MAKRQKRGSARKSKSKEKMKTAKKPVVKRATGRKKSRGTSKGLSAKTSRKRVSHGKRPQAQQMTPVVETEIMDVIDEPAPGVVRVTEIEATRVTVPDSDDDEEE